MRKILFILLSLMTCFSYGQNKETFSVQSLILLVVEVLPHIP